jgi:hypothetical protein
LIRQSGDIKEEKEDIGIGNFCAEEGFNETRSNVFTIKLPAVKDNEGKSLNN